MSSIKAHSRRPHMSSGFVWVLLSLMATVSAHASALLSFSVYNGYRAITLDQPVVFTITKSADTFVEPIFQAVGDYFSPLQGSGGNFPFTINGVSVAGIYSVSMPQTGQTGGGLSPADLLLIGGVHMQINVGDVIQINPGYIITFVPANGTLPVNGAYETYLDGPGGVMSTAGITIIPEPSPGVILLAGLVLFAGICRIHCRNRGEHSLVNAHPAI